MENKDLIEKMDRSVKKTCRFGYIFNGITCAVSSISIIILAAMFIYIFLTGGKSINLKMLISDYNETAYFGSQTIEDTIVYDFKNNSEIYYSTIWGIGLKDEKDFNGNDIIYVAYIDAKSPLNNLTNTVDSSSLSLEVGQAIKRILYIDNLTGLPVIGIAKDGAKAMVGYLDSTTNITELYFSTLGGGIRGSIVTTIYLILLTLIIVIPIGVITATYLSEYAKDNSVTRLIRTLIDMLSGIPSIIFGLIALVIFIPFVCGVTEKSGGSILAGALTLSVMLLPIVIRTTEESINMIPKSFREASLALGASKTETTFKIVLPNAISGILTSVLLAIGRIIGESAALIFAIGTAIQDKVSVSGSSTTLAVHIWTVLTGENPNYSQGCAISIVILVIVLILNISVKLLAKRLNRFEVKQ